MQNKLSFNTMQILPILGILLIFVIQHYHAYQNSQINNDLASKQIENLKADMREDNIPPDIAGHISTVAQNATFQTHLLVDSLTTMQVFFQANILLMVYSFYTVQKKKRKTEE